MEVHDTLKKVKDDQLLTQFEQMVWRERRVTVEVIRYIAEISRRLLYAKEAYPSLYSFLTEKYRYSPGAAYRRIQAAEVSEIAPDILKLLSEGKFNLMTISLIAPHITKENSKMLIQKVAGKSKMAVEYIVADLFGKEKVYRDKIWRLPLLKTKIEKTRSFQQDSVSTGGNKKDMLFHGVTESCTSIGQNSGETKVETASSQNGREANRDDSREVGVRTKGSAPSALAREVFGLIRKVKIEFVADEAVAQKLERAKEILRHKFPAGKLQDIFDQALEDLLEKRDPERKIAKIDLSGSGEGRASRVESRYISAQLKMKIWQRDGGRCTYVSPLGKRCPERGKLEMDHVQPWALGGHTSEANLRLLCSAHNKYQAFKTFGKRFVREAAVCYAAESRRLAEN